LTSTLAQLQRYLGGLTVYLRNLGAELPEPILDRYRSGRVGFDLTAVLPGSAVPSPAVILLAERWQPIGDGFDRANYLYELIDHPFGRRRAFHAHDTEWFAREFGVLVHEHCDEIIGQPMCDHYYGQPVGNGYEALERLLRLWCRPDALGCSDLRCIE
jgi:hypothetical protein